VYEFPENGTDVAKHLGLLQDLTLTIQ